MDRPQLSGPHIRFRVGADDSYASQGEILTLDLAASRVRDSYALATLADSDRMLSYSRLNVRLLPSSLALMWSYSGNVSFAAHPPDEHC